MYENQFKTLLPRRQFYARMARHVLMGLGLVAISLGIGMWGYHSFENMPWIDAFVNAAMILSGMGPVTELKTDGGKFFAGCYALFSGLAFIVLVGIILAPAIHRALHKFHLGGPHPGQKGGLNTVQDRESGLVMKAERITIMIMNMTPILAMHGHFGGRGFLFLLVVVACALIIFCWPGKSESK